MKPRCVCGCGRRSVQKHHVVYEQEIRARWNARREPGARRLPEIHKLADLVRDRRNLVAVCELCHARHHRRVAVLPLRVLPDSVFEFAAELMGAGAAFEYLRRRYAGGDPRLDALLGAEAA